MAIRPVDLQLAYLAGPQNAASVSSAQEAPQAAQQAAQSAFVAELSRREESVDEPQKTEGQKIRERGQRNPQQQQQNRRRQNPAWNDEQSPSPVDFAGDGEQHLIDFTA